VTDAASAAENAPAPVRVTSGSPTPEEVAAVTAVMAAVLEQLADEDRRRVIAAPTAWERSRRGVRRPLIRGDWRRYGR
jgi:hypothetical protein